MEEIKSLFFSTLGQEIEVQKKKPQPFTPAWNVSEELDTSEFKKLEETLSQAKLLGLKGKPKNAILKAFDRYLINCHFLGEIKYNQRLAARVFKRWWQELSDSTIESLLLCPFLNLEVNKKVKIGQFELYPVEKTGNTKDLEKKIYELLGFKIRDFIRIREMEPYRLFYFLGGSAIRIKKRTPKREDFFDILNFPEPGTYELREEMEKFSILLHLFKQGDFEIGSYHYSTVSAFTAGDIRMGEKRYTSGYQYPLVNKSEISRVRKFYNKYYPLISKIDELPTPLQIGVEYFGSSYTKLNLHERLLI